jgi:hypothetical protein
MQDTTMTETDDKPPVTVLYSIGLMNRANRQTFSELGDELTQAGYPTEVGMRTVFRHGFPRTHIDSDRRCGRRCRRCGVRQEIPRTRR